MDTPSQKLASKILDRLIEAELLMLDDRSTLLPVLAEGKIKPEDWRLAIELAQEKRKKE